MFLTFEGVAPAFHEHEGSQPLSYSGASITVDSVIRADRADITVDQGSPGSPMSPEAAVVQEGAEIIEEAV